MFFLLNIVDDRPAVKYINRHVRKYICAAGSHVWLDLGIELLGDEDVAALSAIKSSNVSADREVCFSKMLTLWLERKPKASWRTLIEGLKQILQFKLASDIVDLLDKPYKDVCTNQYDPLDVSFEGMCRATYAYFIIVYCYLYFESHNIYIYIYIYILYLCVCVCQCMCMSACV